MELITTRTQAHIDRLNALKAKGWENLTDSEKEEWYGTAAMGAYNYTDLNRVEAAVAELAEMAGLNLTTKTNWTKWDVPTSEDMSRYIGNLNAIMAACPSGTVFPTVPASMNSLTYTLANNIEKMLLVAETAIYRITHDMWEKYNAIFTSAHYVARLTPPGGKAWQSMRGVPGITFYRSYTFSKYGGYALTNPVTFYPEDNVTESDVLGLYMSGYKWESVYAVTQCEISVVSGVLAMFVTGEQAAYADYYPDTYSKGATLYGRFEVAEGALPESGTLLAGSTSADYCVLNVGGTAYYYSKIY